MNSGYNPQGGMNPEGPFNQTTLNAPLSIAESSAEARMNFIRKTYVLFLAGILSCVLGGVACLNLAPFQQLALIIMGNPILAVAVILGGSIAAQALARVPVVNYIAMFGFTSLLGIVMTPVLLRFSPGVVGQAGMLTTVIFGSLTAYAFISRKNFSFLGGMLFIGMISMIAGGLLNMFLFKSWDFSYWLAWGTLFISSGFVLYKTSNILHEYSEGDEIAAALGLFISFFNIFISLLRILSGRD
jgi:FtsH-binding integral membrane protein